MEPTAALRSIETVLRTAIHRTFEGETWLDAPGAPDRDSLIEKQTAERKKRDGVAVPADLLEYAETFHLTKIVQKSWEKFKPIFDDKKRMDVYFDIVNDVRNPIAHSRRTVPYERDLLSGIAQHMSNLLSLHGLADDASMNYYPTIEQIVDSFGTAGRPFGTEGMHSTYEENDPPRLEIGQSVRFQGQAVSARGKGITWYLMVELPHEIFPRISKLGEGLTLDCTWTVTKDEVREHAEYTVYIVSESNHHRHSALYLGGDKVPFDDAKLFTYCINPPMED